MYDPFSDPSSPDWVGVRSAWEGVTIDLSALQRIVCQVLRVPAAECGPPVEIGLEPEQDPNYARVFSFQLPSQSVVARLVAPVKPLFKTESEVAAMDFVRSRTSLPVPKVFAYCSEANNPVGVEWLIMEHVRGVEMGQAWDDLKLPQKQRLALDLVDLYEQLSRFKADGIGGIYHNVSSVDDRGLISGSPTSRSPRWAPLSPESLRLLKNLCTHSIHDQYKLGPIHDIFLLTYGLVVPPPSQTMPTFSSEDFVKLIAYNGNPATRSEFDYPTRERCVELFRNVYNLYHTSAVLGPSSDVTNYRFSHGDLHSGNIFIDPESGAITGIIDWEAAGFCPLWYEIYGVGWFNEDRQRFLFGLWESENFAEDTIEDSKLRAFFRIELHKRNPDLFSCFLGGVELRAILHAAADNPLPYGETDIFLRKYYKLGYWNTSRRGAFPWDMNAWQYRRAQLDKTEVARTNALEKAAKTAQMLTAI